MADLWSSWRATEHGRRRARDDLSWATCALPAAPTGCQVARRAVVVDLVQAGPGQSFHVHHGRSLWPAPEEARGRAQAAHFRPGALAGGGGGQSAAVSV